MQDTFFVTIPKLFTDEECDQIVHMGEAIVNKTKGGISDGKDSWMNYYRECEIAWFNEEAAEQTNMDFTFFYHKMDGVLHTVMEKVGWDYDLTARQAAQYTSYTKSGHYDWHKDAHSKPYGESSLWTGLIRKMSMVVLLSDPDDYKGGELLGENTFKYTPIEYYKRVTNLTEKEENKQRGTGFIFPSYAHHKVCGVHEGVRKSLVCWWCGPPWK
jgi:PKHD-type hydroxylase